MLAYQVVLFLHFSILLLTELNPIIDIPIYNRTKIAKILIDELLNQMTFDITSIAKQIPGNLLLQCGYC